MRATIPFFILLFGFSNSLQATADEPKVKLIQLGPAKEIFVPALDSGAIRSVEVQVGQSVEAGQVLATLDDQLTTAALEATRLALETSKRESEKDIDRDLLEQAVDAAKQRQQRVSSLLQRHAASAQEMEDADLRLQQAETALQTSISEFETTQRECLIKQQQYEDAKRRNELRTILAPHGGKVVHCFHAPGEWVQKGQPCFRIVDDSQFTARLRIPANQWSDAWADKPLEFRLAKTSPMSSAHVVHVNHRLGKVTGILELTVTFRRPERLTLREFALPKPLAVVFAKPSTHDTHLVSTGR